MLDGKRAWLLVFTRTLTFPIRCSFEGDIYKGLKNVRRDFGGSKKNVGGFAVLGSLCYRLSFKRSEGVVRLADLCNLSPFGSNVFLENPQKYFQLCIHRKPPNRLRKSIEEPSVREKLPASRTHHRLTLSFSYSSYSKPSSALFSE